MSHSQSGEPGLFEVFTAEMRRAVENGDYVNAHTRQSFVDWVREGLGTTFQKIAVSVVFT